MGIYKDFYDNDATDYIGKCNKVVKCDKVKRNL